MKSNQEDPNDQLVVISGASSGIGAAAACEFAKHHMQVVLLARREDRLNKVAKDIRSNGGRTHVIPVDLSIEAERERVCEEIKAKYGTPAVLINNAGFAWYGFYHEMPWETAREEVMINVIATLHLTRLFLPGVLARKRGAIINVGSIVGQFPNQGIAIYSGTKAFLDAFTTVLHRETQRSGVHVSVIRPGPVSTELFDMSESLPGSRRLPSERFAVTSEAVARRIWRLYQKPRKVVYYPWYTGFSPWIELLFGWLIDRLGPLLLIVKRR